MSTAVHTPGPWHVVVSDNGTPHIQHEQGDDWTDINDLGSRVCVMPAEIMQSFNAFANARLIAAAPDLLEFAQWFVENRDGPGASMARAAIAKATGGAA